MSEEIKPYSFLFDSLNYNFLLQVVYVKNSITLAQAVPDRRRAFENDEFEYRQNNHKSCTFRHFQLVMKFFDSAEITEIKFRRTSYK